MGSTVELTLKKGVYVPAVPHITGNIVNSKLEASLYIQLANSYVNIPHSKEECWLFPTLQC